MKNTEENRPELPDGYRVEVTKLGLELWHLNSSHCLVVFNDGVFCFNPVYPKDAPAVISFLQVAVLTEDGRLLSSAKKHHHAALAAFLQGAK